MDMISVLANNCEIKYLFSGSRNFRGHEDKLLTFSQCGQFLSVAEGFAVWVWNCGRLVSLMEHSEPVSGKFSYSYAEGRVTTETWYDIKLVISTDSAVFWVVTV
jgi:hypothetical protein